MMKNFFLQPPACENGTVCSETSAHKIQTPGNNPEESIQDLFYFVLFYNSVLTYKFSMWDAIVAFWNHLPFGHHHPLFKIKLE